MSRLIDADVLMKDIVKRFGCKPYIEVGNKCEYVHDIIDEQPTAYDTNKVEEEMYSHLFDKYCVEDDEKVGEIIKKGGVANE